MELLAEELNNSGYEIKKVMAVKQVDVPWTTDTIKELLYKPIMQAMHPGKTSTTQLDTKEISEVWEVLNRHLAENFGVSVQFPSDEPPMI